MNPEVSVVICSHNPIKLYISRVLDALKNQTLSYDKWELIIIDNASNTPISSETNIDWHPNGKHIVEPTLGLTHARQTGVKISCADIIVFVDDDNILDYDYLENVLAISLDNPNIGAWGGQIHAEYEIPPEAWAKNYLWMLAIRELKIDRWSNIPYCYDSAPCGAGLCVKRSVAEEYSTLLKSSPERQNLDRKGQSLMSCGDVDLACTACDIGLGTGVFTCLELTHIIPAKRLQQDYLLRLAEANGYSTVIVESLRGKFPAPTSRITPIGKLRKIYQGFRTPPIERLFSAAFERGHNRALQEVNHLRGDR
jgi:glycosyltransferase involved in cell wall biosynthesis